MENLTDKKKHKSALYAGVVWVLSGVALTIYGIMGMFKASVPGAEQAVDFLVQIEGRYIYLGAFVSIFIEGLYFIGSFFSGVIAGFYIGHTRDIWWAWFIFDYNFRCISGLEFSWDNKYLFSETISPQGY